MTKKVLLDGDFNAQIGREKIYQKSIGKYPAHKFTGKNGTIGLSNYANRIT